MSIDSLPSPGVERFVRVSDGVQPKLPDRKGRRLIADLCEFGFSVGYDRYVVGLVYGFLKTRVS